MTMPSGIWLPPRGSYRTSRIGWGIHLRKLTASRSRPSIGRRGLSGRGWRGRDCHGDDETNCCLSARGLETSHCHSRGRAYRESFTFIYRSLLSFYETSRARVTNGTLSARRWLWFLAPASDLGFGDL